MILLSMADRLPRPKGRGPIEAPGDGGGGPRRWGLPRPKGRGPIEAALLAELFALPETFRGRKVAAPLKPA